MHRVCVRRMTCMNIIFRPLSPNKSIFRAILSQTILRVCASLHVFQPNRCSSINSAPGKKVELWENLEGASATLFFVKLCNSGVCEAVANRHCLGLLRSMFFSFARCFQPNRCTVQTLLQEKKRWSWPKGML